MVEGLTESRLLNSDSQHAASALTWTKRMVGEVRFDQSPCYKPSNYNYINYFIAKYNTPNIHWDKIVSLSYLYSVESDG